MATPDAMPVDEKPEPGPGDIPAKPPKFVTIRLLEPIEFGKDTIEEMTLKPTARSFKEFSLPVKEDGTMLYEPYKLASVGVRMAGHPNAVADKLGIDDMNEIAQAVLSFLGRGLKTGTGR